MFVSRLLSAFSLVLAFAVASPAMAQPVQPFTIAALHAAQAAGKPILVDAYADWCPICRKQAPTIAAIAADPAFSKLVILRLDFDTQQAEKRLLGILQQSTLIAYDGTKETGRLVGVTDPAQIKALASSGIR